MNKIIASRGKEIIFCLLAVILLLIYLLINSGNDKEQNVPGTPIAKADLKNFLSLLIDPVQNVGGIAFIAPDRSGKLVLFNKFLKSVEPCHKPFDNHQQHENLPANKQEISIPSECTKGKLVPDINKSQVLALTPATRVRQVYKKDQNDYASTKGFSEFEYVIVQDFDHHAYCVPVLGRPCP